MPIEIDWLEVFSRDVGADVCFTTPSPPAPSARAGPARGKRKADTPWTPRRSTRFWGERGRRLPLDPISPTEASPKAADDDTGCDARASALKVYEFGPEDVAGERLSHRYCAKKSPISSGKKNYRQLEMNSGGKRKPIPVDLMYSSKPCSPSFSAHKQRVHAVDPEEVEFEKCQRSQNHGLIDYSKRRGEQLEDSSSRYNQKVEDVVFLDDEEQPKENVDYRNPDEQIESQIYYPSRDDPEAVELSGSDIRCLEPEVYLSSPVINFYIQYIKRNQLATEDKFYIFNTYFYSKLEEALVRPSDFLKLRRWWKGVNIFHRAYIILPIHGMSHWSLVIICNPGKESDTGPIILHLDSLEMHSSNKIFGTVKKYLEEEWRYLKYSPPPDTPISESVWKDLPGNIHTQIVQVPQQNNAYDCGIFMLYYIERFVREAPERFSRDNLGMFSRSWFNCEDASRLRGRIQALLLEEFESARLDNAMSDAASDDGSDKEDIIKGGELEAVAPSDCSEMPIVCAESGDSGKNNEALKVETAEEGSGECGWSHILCNTTDTVAVADMRGQIHLSPAALQMNSRGDTGKSNVRTSEVPASDEAPTVSNRHDENVDCILSEAATLSDSTKEEDPVKACGDSSKAEEDEELAIVSPGKWKSREVTSMPCPDIVCDSCDSDSDGVIVVDVRKRRRATRRNCLKI